MKQKLLLTSQGLITNAIKDKFLQLVGKEPKDIVVVYIITAAYGEAGDKSWIEENKRPLRKLGIKIEDVDLRDKSKDELERIFTKTDVVYVEGGNTFYLLYWARKSGFDQLLPKLLEQGKLYVGVSAGSYIACPTIEMANWKHQDRNKIGLKNLTALNLVPFFITAHFEEKHRLIIKKEARNTRYPIVALNDKQALTVKDERIKIIGEGEKVFFNNFSEN